MISIANLTILYKTTSKKKFTPIYDLSQEFFSEKFDFIKEINELFIRLIENIFLSVIKIKSIKCTDYSCMCLNFLAVCVVFIFYFYHTFMKKDEKWKKNYRL